MGAFVGGGAGAVGGAGLGAAGGTLVAPGIGTIGGGIAGGVAGEAAGSAGGALVGGGIGAGAGYLLGSIVCSSGSGGPGTGSAGEEKPTAQLKKLSPSEIRKLEAEGGAHQIKGEALGTNKGISQYDLYKDTSGNIYVAAKGGIGEAIPTGLNINHF